MRPIRFFLILLLCLPVLGAAAQGDSGEEVADSSREVTFHMLFEPGACAEYLYEEVQCVHNDTDTLEYESTTTRFSLRVVEADSTSALLVYRELLRDDSAPDAYQSAVKHRLISAFAAAFSHPGVLIRVTDGGCGQEIENMDTLRACVMWEFGRMADELYALYEAEAEAHNASGSDDEQEEVASHHEVKQALRALADSIQPSDVLSQAAGLEQFFELAGISPVLGHDERSGGGENEYTTISVSLAETELPESGAPGYEFEIGRMTLATVSPDEEAEGDKADTASGPLLMVSNLDTRALLDLRFQPVTTTTTMTGSYSGEYLSLRKSLVRTAYTPACATP